MKHEFEPLVEEHGDLWEGIDSVALSHHERISNKNGGLSSSQGLGNRDDSNSSSEDKEEK